MRHAGGKLTWRRSPERKKAFIVSVQDRSGEVRDYRESIYLACQSVEMKMMFYPKVSVLSGMIETIILMRMTILRMMMGSV